MAKLDSQVYYTTKFTNFEIALSQTPFDLPQNNGCAPLPSVLHNQIYQLWDCFVTNSFWSSTKQWLCSIITKNQILNNIILRIHAHPCIQLEMQ